MSTYVGDRLTRRVTLSAAEIAEYARLSGDPNPLHHDEDYARASRFGGIIASGPQVIGLLLGILPAQFADRGKAVLGLEFTFRFVKGSPAGVPLDFTWQIVGQEAKDRLGGDIVTVEGSVQGPAGDVYLTAMGKALILPRT